MMASLAAEAEKRSEQHLVQPEAQQSNESNGVVHATGVGG
jgi:hypothetical protein